MQIHKQSKYIRSWKTLWHIQFQPHTICTTRNKNPGLLQSLKEINICSSWIRLVLHRQSTVTLKIIQMLHDNNQSWENFINSWILPSPFWHAQNLIRRCSSNCRIKIYSCSRKSNNGITIQSWRTCTSFHKKPIRDFKICSTTTIDPTSTAR